MDDLYDILLQTAKRGSRIQDNEIGSMPSGHNGPWKHIDTPIRNTSHWTITFLTAYRISGVDKFRDHAIQCVDFLTSDVARPQQSTFIHRKDGSDRCNGLIGQAWTLEALIYANKYIKQNLIREAEEVFLLHPFDWDFGLWHSIDVDGTVGSLHPTFNQQLWFAAIGAQLAKHNEDIETNVSRFLDRLHTNLRLTDNGLIVHNSYPHEGYRRLRYDIKNVLFSGLQKRRRELAIGYHSFNLYGMALLYREYPDHSFWDTAAFESALHYAASDQFLSAARDNRYCFGYNPTGLELAFAGETFNYAALDVQKWVERQLSLTFDPLERLMSKGDDPTTLAARFYEAARLSNIELDDISLFVEDQDQ